MASIQSFLNACEKGDLQTFKQLLPRVNINEKNENGYSGLALAVRNGHTDIAFTLIRSDSDINSINEVTSTQAGQSVLFLACWHNREDCVKALLQSGALINIPDNRGWTPLIISVYHNYLSIVQILLDRGADTSHKDCFGKKALDRSKTDEMTELLLRYDSSIEKRTTPNTLGRIMNSSISSIQSDNKPPPKSHEYKKSNNKLQEDLESHVKFQTKKIEKELVGEWSEILEQCLNEELFQAEQILLEEVENFVTKSVQDNYVKLRNQCLAAIDENYRGKGFKIPPSQIPFDFHLQVSLGKPGRVQRSLDKFWLESDELYFDSSASDPNDIRLEVVKYIENSIENMASKFESISNEVINTEIPNRINKMKNLIANEVKEFIEGCILNVKRNIDEISEERVREITMGNKVGGEKKMKESQSASFVQPEKSFKHKYEENYEFIENLANNYSGFSKTPQESSLSGSFVKEQRISTKKNEKFTPKAMPRSEASQLLQQFLKK